MVTTALIPVLLMVVLAYSGSLELAQWTVELNCHDSLQCSQEASALQAELQCHVTQSLMHRSNLFTIRHPFNSVLMEHLTLVHQQHASLVGQSLSAMHTHNLSTVVQYVHAALSARPQVNWFKQDRILLRSKRSLLFEDPQFPNQWHLKNTRSKGMDINVTSVWQSGIKGSSVTIVVIDDGLEWSNPDIRPNYCALCSWDLNSDDSDPMPNMSISTNHHGTRCAGEIAAAANSVCGVGVAYRAQIAGIRILDGPMTDLMEATAFTKHLDLNDIYSCSWGPEDDGKTVDGPDALGAEALRHGTEHGRGGRGVIYVVASGNGGSVSDNCNYDGYANSIYTFTIGAVDESGNMPYYGEECASMFAVTFSSGAANLRQIVTTDWVKAGGCTNSHTGTSAAAPIAAGLLALALDARPCLTWRDLMYVVTLTARPVDTYLAHWTYNAAGLAHSHQHGFGLMDAWQLVSGAKVWSPVPPLSTFTSPLLTVGLPIGPGSLQVDRSVSATDLYGYQLTILEQVQVQVFLTHHCRGALSLELRCPSGTPSILAAPRPLDISTQGFQGWVFTTVRCWGEEAVGTYTLVIKDTETHSQRGSLQQWLLKLHGTDMSRADFNDRKSLVQRSFMGVNLSASVSCPVTDLSLPYHYTVSDRTLKMLLVSGIFCLLMAVYETLEYMFCYNDEKAEQARLTAAQLDACGHLADYIPLTNISSD